MTRWQTRSEMVTKNLPMQRVFRVVDGVEEVDVRIFATKEEACTKGSFNTLTNALLKAN